MAGPPFSTPAHISDYIFEGTAGFLRLFPEKWLTWLLTPLIARFAWPAGKIITPEMKKAGFNARKMAGYNHYLARLGVTLLHQARHFREIHREFDVEKTCPEQARAGQEEKPPFFCFFHANFYFFGIPFLDKLCARPGVIVVRSPDNVLTRFNLRKIQNHALSRVVILPATRPARARFLVKLAHHSPSNIIMALDPQYKTDFLLGIAAGGNSASQSVRKIPIFKLAHQSNRAIILINIERSADGSFTFQQSPPLKPDENCADPVYNLGVKVLTLFESWCKAYDIFWINEYKYMRQLQKKWLKEKKHD